MLSYEDAVAELNELLKGTSKNPYYLLKRSSECGIMKIIQSRNHYAEVTDTCCLWRGWFD